MARRGVLVVLIIVLSSLLIVPAAATVSDRSMESPPVAQAGSETVSLTQTFHRNSETPGSVRITTAADMTLKLKEFDLFVPESATELSADGFRQTPSEDPIDGFERYSWDGSTRSVSVTYRLDVNTTTTRVGTQEMGYQTVDTGDWAIIDVPGIPYSWSASEDITVTKHNKVAGPGVIGDGFAFLGAHELQTHTANGQEFRLVIPETTNLTAEPRAIFQNLAFASKQLDVGARDERVTMIAVPIDNNITWAHGGFARDSMFWIQADSKLDTPHNTWIHEYVHTRQDFPRAQDFEWFAEGSANYYAAYYTYQQGNINYDEFRRYISSLRSKNASAVLTDTADFSRPQYTKGGFTVARADQQIRLASNRSASVTDVFGRLNDETSPVSNREFIRYVGLFSTSDVESDVQAATTTSELMSMWNRDGFEAAFDENLPPRQASSDPATDSSNGSIDPRLSVLLLVMVLVLGLFRFNTDL